MGALIKNELYKTFKSKKIYVFLGILFILTFVIGLMFNSVKQGVENLKGAGFPIGILTGITDFLLPVLLTILVTSMITEEYQNGTLKLPLLYARPRGQVFNSKLLSILTIILMLLISALIFSYIAGIVFWGWEQMFSVEQILSVFKAYMLSVIPLMALAIVIAFIALRVSGSGIIIGIVVSILILSNLIIQFFEGARPYLLTYYLKVFSAEVDINNLVLGVMVSLVYGVVFYILARGFFGKMDILK